MPNGAQSACGLQEVEAGPGRHIPGYPQCSPQDRRIRHRAPTVDVQRGSDAPVLSGVPISWLLPEIESPPQSSDSAADAQRSATRFAVVSALGARGRDYPPPLL